MVHRLRVPQAEGDLTDIKMAYMIFNTAAPDMGLVQDEINKISEKEIGVHVTLEPIAVGDLCDTGEPDVCIRRRTGYCTGTDY